MSLLLVGIGFLLIAFDSTAEAARKFRRLVVGAASVAVAWSAMPSDVSYVLNEAFIPDNHKILHYSEGVEGTVVVSGPADETHGRDRALWINKMQATMTIDKGVKIPSGVEIGWDLEKDRQRGFSISEGGIVVIAKSDGVEHLLRADNVA